MATQTEVQGALLEIPNGFEKELWRIRGRYMAAHGIDLCKKEEELAERLGWFMWDMGDWLLEGEEGGLSTKQLRREAGEICPSRTWHTMENWKVTSRAIEPSRRRDGREGRASLPYSLHKVVEKFAPEVQDQLLEMAVAGDPALMHKDGTFRPFTVKSLGNKIWHMQRIGKLPKTGRDLTRKVRPKKFTSVRVKVTVSDHEKFMALAVAKCLYEPKPRWGDNPWRLTHAPDVGAVIAWMAGEYIKEHKPELKALCDQGKKKLDDEKRLRDIVNRPLDTLPS